MKTALILLCAIALGMVACKPPRSQTFGLICPTGADVRTRFSNDVEAKWCYDKAYKMNDGAVVIFGPSKDGVLNGGYRQGVRDGTWSYHDKGTDMEFVFDGNGNVKTATIYFLDAGNPLLSRKSRVECALVFQDNSQVGQYQCQCVTVESTPGKANSKTFAPGNNCNGQLPWYARFVESS